MVLEKAKAFAINHYSKDEDTVAILLVGAWARNTTADVNDIDVVVLKRFQLSPILSEDLIGDGFKLEAWIHDYDSFIYELESPIEDANNLATTSTILQALSEGIIWLDKTDGALSAYIEQAKSWVWDDSLTELLDFELQGEPQADWAKHAVEENLSMLKFAKQRIIDNLPVSHKRKNYPSLLKQFDETTARTVFEKTTAAIHASGINHMWSDYKDAEKALATGNWANVVASCKDVLRFLIRYDLVAVPTQLLDPNTWLAGEQLNLSKILRDAVEAAFV